MTSIIVAAIWYNFNLCLFRKGRTYRNDLNTQVTVQGANRPKSIYSEAWNTAVVT
jgi:hypothetical protein